MSLSKQQLIMEVTYFHKSLFNRVPPSQLIAAYLDAHAAIAELKQPNKQQLNIIEKIITRKLDAVAIEPWLRLPNQRHILTSKLMLINYLAETDTLHPEFARHGSGLLTGYGRLALAGIKGIARLTLGRLQKTLYGIN